MRIVIDGNACPATAKKTCMAISEQFFVPVFLVTENRPSLEDTGNQDVPAPRLEKPGERSYKMASLVTFDDIVVTYDYFLAAALYKKVLAVIHPSGYIYNQSNMDQLLYYRYMDYVTHVPGQNKNARIKKRSAEEDELFKALLSDLVRPVILPDSAE